MKYIRVILEAAGLFLALLAFASFIYILDDIIKF